MAPARLLLPALLSVSAAACSPSPAPEASRSDTAQQAQEAAAAPDVPLARAEQAEARNCLPVGEIAAATPVSNGQIDFSLRSGVRYRNMLPQSCPGLAQFRAFTFPPAVDQLCRGSEIRVVRQDEGYRFGAACPLGSFIETG